MNSFWLHTVTIALLFVLLPVEVKFPWRTGFIASSGT